MTQGTMRRDLYPELYRVEDRHWWHQQKRRVVHGLIKKYHPAPGRVLDVGCGAGKLLEELQQLHWQAEGADAVTAEAKKRSLKIAKVNLQTENLPYPANHFNLAVCLDTLEHMVNDRRLTEEIVRVVKKNGIIIISVPAYPRLFSYWDKMLGHFRRYNHRLLLKAIPKNKVKIKFFSYYFSFLLLPAIFVRLVKIVFRQNHSSDFAADPLPALTHGFVGFFGSLELLWLKRFKIPFGLSLVCVLQKK